MKIKKRISDTSGDSLLSILLHKYLPYWPLFAILALVFVLAAFIASRYITPTYKISATLVINDKERGTRESETLRSLNVYAGDKIIENEILVLTSRTLVRDVVTDLNLYAPVFEEGDIKPASAYLSSPVVVQVREPARLIEQEEIGFSYDAQTEQVIVGDQRYQLGKWVNLNNNTVRFMKNPHQKRASERDLYFSLMDPRKVTVGVLNNLEAGATSKLSSVININYSDAVPERGEHIVNALLEAYMGASVANNNQLAQNTLAFLAERLESVERDLDSINRRVQQYRSAEGVVDLSEQGRLYLQNVAENDRKLADLNMQLAVLDQVERYVRSGANNTGVIPTTLGIQDPVLADLIQTLNELELRYASLRTTTGANNPLTESVESEIQRIRPNILDIVRNQRLRMQASRNNLASTTQRFNTQLSNIPQRERELLEISRQQAIKNDVYAFLLQRQEEAELSAASTIADSRIVDWAEASLSPASSKRLILLVGALIAAFACAMAFVFMQEGLRNKVLFRDDIERRTTIPVVAEIPHLNGIPSSTASTQALPALRTTFKQLQATLGLFDPELNRRRILVTSSLENAGKTFVSNQLALSLAKAGKRVLLLDLNLHTSETSKQFGLNDAPGYSDLISGKVGLRDAVYTTETDNLAVLPAGSRTENATALLWNDGIKDLFKELSQNYDFIVVDSPPVELTTDAYLISRFCDVSLLVVRHGKTPATILQQLEGNSKPEAMPGLGIVFNDIKPRGFLRKYYGYGYGYGYEAKVESRHYAQIN